MTEQQVQELYDLLHSIGNKVKIATLLLHLGKEELLPTVLEDMYINCHEIIDDYCIREKP